jgi:hypothetical protein
MPKLKFSNISAITYTIAPFIIAFTGDILET